MLVGEAHPNARLTEEAVRRMRALRKDGGYSYAQLGTIFNVSETTAKRVVNRVSWKHVP